MENHIFTILAVFAILFGIAISLHAPSLGLTIIGGVLVGGILLLIWRVMRL